MKKLCVLALMHEDLIPPEKPGEGVDLATVEWKTEYDIVTTLRDMGHEVSASRIPKLLEKLHYRRQVNRKTKEGSHHPDRDAQFEHINQQVVTLQAAGQPVISVDTKKKELIGAYKKSVPYYP